MTKIVGRYVRIRTLSTTGKSRTHMGTVQAVRSSHWAMSVPSVPES
jgi:hypothetical protein